MGALDVERQALNVFRMKLLGATVRPVEAGSRTLKDAMNEAIRDWITNVETTHYLIGSAAGPHPYPEIVRDLQSVIGREARAQNQQRAWSGAISRADGQAAHHRRDRRGPARRRHGHRLRAPGA